MAMASRSIPRLLLITALLFVATPAFANEVKQQRNLVEIGIYLGMYMPPSDHELYEYPLPHREFDSLNFDVGLRAGYYLRYYLGAEVELGLMPVGTTGASGLGYTFRAHAIGQYPVWKRLCPFVLLGGGFIGVSSDDDAVGSDLDGMVYWGLGAKYYVTDYLSVRAEFRHDMTNGLKEGLSNHVEVLFGVSWVFGWRSGDKDGDGVPDSRDSCPAVAAKTDNGCPPKDTDGDGVTDDKDACPQKPASTKDGCPENLDPDGDGVVGEADRCPQKPETKNGFQDADGCPDTVPDAVKNFTGAIRGVTFPSGKARIRSSSFKTLDKAVVVLKKFVSLRLKIRGHTDNTGKHEANVELSRNRAEAVKAYLVKKGIAAERLSTEGLGPDEPVADNKKSAGRAKNRRIEFKLAR
ncbi:MAG: OmpA family protein [Deltaproteobacteria bacterium]|nr:OmpA family protein [Deltaproteobacteria bacterium]